MMVRGSLLKVETEQTEEARAAKKARKVLTQSTPRAQRFAEGLKPLMNADQGANERKLLKLKRVSRGGAELAEEIFAFFESFRGSLDDRRILVACGWLAAASRIQRPRSQTSATEQLIPDSSLGRTSCRMMQFNLLRGLCVNFFIFTLKNY
jgi:hypothetical protein